MKYRFGMPWYGWLLVFILLVLYPTVKKELFSATSEPKKDIAQKTG